MQLKDIKGERALDIIADIIDPLTEIISDSNVRAMAKNKSDRPKLIKLLLKNHKTAILTIMALLDGAEPESYEPSIVEIPAKLFDLFNDPDISRLFFTQAQAVQTQSSSAMASTEGEEN